MFKRKPCPVCGSAVDKEQATKDSLGRNFHKECLKCATCKASMTGRRALQGDNLVVTRNDVLLVAGAGGTYCLCESHAPKATPNVAKEKKQPASPASSSGSPAMAGEDDDAIAASRKSVKEKMTLAKQAMEAKAGGDAKPQCSRCGQPIENDQALVVSGMMRFHQTCPSKEEISMSTKSTRHFLKKTPERLVVLFTCDADKANKYSFIFVVNADSLAAGLRRGLYDDTELVFQPDFQARASVSRKLIVPTTRAFDLGAREFFPFSFTDPRTGLEQTPVLEDCKAVITKYYLSNGVLLVLQAVLSYDESALLVAPDGITVNFSMYPPRPREPNKSFSSRSKSIVDTDRVLHDFAVV